MSDPHSSYPTMILTEVTIPECPVDELKGLMEYLSKRCLIFSVRVSNSSPLTKDTDLLHFAHSDPLTMSMDKEKLDEMKEASEKLRQSTQSSPTTMKEVEE